MSICISTFLHAKINRSMDQVPQVQEQPELAQKNKLPVFIPFFIFLLVLVILLGFFIIITRGISTNLPASVINSPNSTVQVSPTPFLFQELTIPYLREKDYTSSLSALEQVGSNGNYTSYVTNYISEGLKVNGLLTIPVGEEPEGGWPAIIFIHGYIPPAQYNTISQYSAYVDYLARNGFVVFKIDLRGHGTSEGEPGGGYYGSDYITDTLSAYSALQNSDFVNPQKIGLWGHSMAGNIVLRSLAAKPEIPGGVIWAGAVFTYLDWQKYGISDSSYSPPNMSQQRQSRRQQLFQQHGSPSAQSEFWQQVAPTNYLSDLQGAIELHHAVDDNVVNIGYSRDLIDLLEETNVPHELHEYQSGGHNISGVSFNTAMERTVEFFKKTLQ